MTPTRAIACCLTAVLCLAGPANSDNLRVATFNVELLRDGPGILLRDLNRGKSPQIDAVAKVISSVVPDVLAIQGFDWDYNGAALAAFSALLDDMGLSYPHHFAARPNSGLATDLDLDGDGRLGGPGDAQGFGTFSGQGGIAVLSRYPIRMTEVQDFSDLLWKDLPNALLPTHIDTSAFPSEEAKAVQRLSNTAHWIVPIALPNGETLSLMTFHANPPVFDGPEDRNGRRNHDEIIFWQAILDGLFGTAPDMFILAGDANLDPFDSDGRTEAIRGLLADPRFQDPQPASAGAALVPDQGHTGKNEQDTVDWEGIGRFRVDYVLPSAQLTVTGTGVYWPPPDEPGHDDALAASRHRLVWVDIALE